MSEENVEQNLANLREKNNELQARLDALMPAAVNETIREVGLDPNKGNGVVLKELMGSDPDLEKAQSYVAKFGWTSEEAAEEATPPPTTLTPQEQAALSASERQDATTAVATSDDRPPNDWQVRYAEANARLAAAQQEGNRDAQRAANKEVLSLNNQLLARQIEERRNQ